MNRSMSMAAAVSLFALQAATAIAADAVLPPRAATVATDAVSALRRPEPPVVRAVVPPPRPTVETIVQPGLNKIEKHERLTDVLKARKRAGRSDRVTAD